MSLSPPQPETAQAADTPREGGMAAGRLRFGIAVSVLMLLCSTTAWYLTRPEGPTPAEQLSVALGLLDEGQNQTARETAKRLEALGYRDPGFPGAIEFILGLVAFRNAEAHRGDGQRQQYILAASYLREAELRALSNERRPEWSFALGVSLQQLGLTSEARPLLEVACADYEPGRVTASLLLADAYLDPGLKTPELLQRALDLNGQVLNAKLPSAAQRERAWLQRARILVALGRTQDAENCLQKLQAELKGDAAPSRPGLVVVQALIRIAEGRYQEAIERLSTIVSHHRQDQTSVRQASYLMGTAAEALARDKTDRETAIIYYERTIDRFERSEEALAASLRMAELLRRDRNNEQALQAYGAALRMVRRPEDFHNRWLSLAQFRETILKAWNGWIDQQAYADAIALSELMTPLFPREQAYELAARAQQAWAEAIETELKEAPWSVRRDRRTELWQRWLESGRAFDRLAQARRTAVNYPEALWTSAEHYRRGHDYLNALRQYQLFLETRPRELLPVALLRCGQLQLDLDHLDEASRLFQQIVSEHPSDPSAFEAQYLLGQCALEQNRPDLAERIWRRMLVSDDLTPAAAEWRLSLFALGRLLYDTAELRMRQVLTHPGGESSAEAKQWLSEAFLRWDEAVERLDEYVKRYPESTEAPQARYLLAKALQQGAGLPQRRLQAAETENAQQEARSELKALLSWSAAEFESLREDLLTAAQEDRLDEIGQEILRNCCFETAHTRFALEQFDQAIAAYTSAANRYPQDAQVLMAYVQMANCYDRLGKPAEARSMLEQAKIILKQQIPDTAFQAASTNLNRQEWEQWLDWATGLHQ